MVKSITNQNINTFQDPETEFGLRPNTDNPMPLGVAMMPEGVRSVYDVASNYNRANNLQNNDTSGGYLSNLRHGTAASQMRDALGGGPVGILGANVLGLAQEVPGLAKGVTDEVKELFGGPESSFMNTLNQTGEDIYANLYGSLYGKKGTTAETYADLANKFATDTGFINTALDATANKQNSLMPDRNALNQSGLFNAITNYGVANAAETMPTSYDYYSKSSNNAQDIAKTTNPYDFSEVDSMTADEQAQLPIDPLTPQRSMFSKAMDFMPFIGDKSLTGMATRGIGNLFSGLGNMFERRDGMATVDEFGNLISGEELDKQNALGGYYTDAARSSRSRASRIQNMLARQATGKRISEQNLLALQEQQAKEDAARQAEFDAIMSSQQSQQNFYDSLNDGAGATSTAESRSTAGTDDTPGTPFANGGLATMFVEKR